MRTEPWICPDCGWIQRPHPAYGWQPHDARAVEVHQHYLCSELAR